MALSNLEFSFQFGVLFNVIALMIVCESPSMANFLMSRSLLNNDPFVNASNSAMFFVTLPIGLPNLAQIEPCQS